MARRRDRQGIDTAMRRAAWLGGIQALLLTLAAQAAAMPVGRIADVLVDDPAGVGQDPDILAQCQAVRAAAFALRDDSLQAGELAAAWQAQGASGGRWTFNVVSNVMRYVAWKARHWMAVYEQPWEPYSQDDDRRHVFSIIYREVLLGFVELDQGRLGLAERHAREAMRQVQLQGDLKSVSAALAAPLLARLHHEQGRHDEAEALLLPLTSLIDNTSILDSVMHAYLVLARIARAHGQVERGFALLEHAEAIGYNRDWDRLVAALLLEHLRWLLAEGRLDEARAIGVRLTRLAAAHEAAPPSARSDLPLYRDWGLALFALADQRARDAQEHLAPLLARAKAEGLAYRAMELSATLALAEEAGDRRPQAFNLLHDLMAAVQRTGAGGCVLDVGPDIVALLQRFMVSSQCDAAMVESVQRLLGRGRPAAATGRIASHGGTSALTERERDVLVLVAVGQSNKEVARAMHISGETVKSHLKCIYTKLGVKQRAQAVALARSLGLIEGPAD